MESDGAEEELPTYRRVRVPAGAHGMRLDRFLALRFRDRSRTHLARCIRLGQVTDRDGRALSVARIVREGEEVLLYVDGIAPGGPPPAFPPVLYEDARVVAVDKPAGLMTHPAGSAFVYGLIALARGRWPHDRVDLVHRLDRDTSGVQLLTRDLPANRLLKASLHEEGTVKSYLALCKGQAPWEQATLDGPIGPAGGMVRIQMGVRGDGQPARTDVTVLGRRNGPGPGLTLVRCRIHTGRTHQIRVHLSAAGLPVLGDRLYGVPPEIFLAVQAHGMTPEVLEQAGADRQALHAERIVLPHPDGGTLDVSAPLPSDLQRWWDHPEELPWRP